MVENYGGNLKVALYTGGVPKKVAAKGSVDQKLVCILISDAVIVLDDPPETDMVLALSQSRKVMPKVIPAEYLDVDLIAVESRIDEVETAANNAQTTANAAQTTANNAKTTADAAATKENPVVTGTFSQNRQPNSTVGIYSHAEGRFCSATSEQSHAEGYLCEAAGKCSHAEGLWTQAYSENQHVQGAHNIIDRASKYAHIVGNGTANNDVARSNAHTLDWNGVPWYQGRPQFGGTAQDNGSQTVMANGDKEIILTSSTASSTKKFKITVDDTGTLKVTEVTA